MRISNRGLGAAYLILALLPAVAWADLIFTAPPREAPGEGQALYAPIADYMSELLGREVRYEHPGGWLEYSNRMRDGEYHIIFDGPHFAAWRMAELDHRPIARMAGALKFYLVRDRENDTLNGLEDLIGRQVCGPPSPNLGTLTVYAEYPNPLQQPTFYNPSGGFVRTFQGIEKGECEGAVIRTLTFHNALDMNQQASVRIIYESGGMPNQGFTASTALSQVERDQLRHAITGTPRGDSPLRGLIDRFGGGDATGFVESTVDEHEGLEDLLRGVIRGW